MPKIPNQVQAFTPGETAPLMKGGSPVCSYETSGYRAILAKDPQSLNPTLKYLHILLVYPDKYNEPPVMYITAEQAHLTPSVLASMPDEMRKAAQQYAGQDVFLTVYDKNGKSNLGSDDDIAILEKFESKALALMRETLGITASIQVLNDVRKGGSFSRGGCLGVILGGVGLGAGLIIGIWQISKLLA